MPQNTTVDLSHPFTTDMPVYPGDEPASLYKVRTIREHGFSNHRLETCMHVGTHIDTPLHMVEGEKTAAEIPMERLFGRGIVIDCRDKPEIAFDTSYEQIIHRDNIVLFHTGHGRLFGSSEYFKKFPNMTMQLAEFLADTRVNMIGLDTPCPDHDPYPVHKKLFEKNIYIIENLANLEQLPYNVPLEVFVFPLKVEADAAPVRVVARFECT